jgi:soluble lytic murein transglycosylase-like protein
MNLRHRALYVWLLTVFALHSVWSAPTEPTPSESLVLLPPVSAPAPRAEVNPVPAELAEVRAHLARYAHRAGLTTAEVDAIAEAIVVEAERHDLEPQLILAVMHVESRYDPYAVSPVSAMGLMQILPSTGEWLAPQVGVAWAGPHTLFDPIANVQLGVAYLRMLSDRYDGRIHTALAAYNWGPGAIDRRLRNGTAVPRIYPELVQHAYDRAAKSTRS